ncbi:MAG: hypothetical protein LBR88_07650 [Zoogloeaceae bacterium]|nr:hypothetical protein [Zoogloeaceae bacterium]
MLKSRRNDCEGILTSAASALERNRAVTGSYGYPDDGNDENDAVGDWPAHFKLCPASNEKNVDRSKPPAETSYVVTRSVPTGGATETTFHLIATPAGAQTADKCGNLTLDHNGVKGASKGSVADCWR